MLFASLDNPVIAKIGKQSTYQEPASYDDGYASIFPHEIYTVETKDEIYNEAKLFLKEHTQKHYTIYKNDFHIIPVSKRVILDGVFDLDYSKAKNGKPVKLLLGQNLLLHTHSHNAATIVRYYKGLGVYYYLPHPKEVGFIPGLNILETDLTLEDLLLELWKKYENVIFYHFYSSAALHLIDRENVKAIGIRLPHLKNHQERLEELGHFFHIPQGMYSREYKLLNCEAKQVLNPTAF
ncbi:glycosyltransferase family 52 [Streptococcus ruminantium]|uniref:glycosyltransferase family 52 n=1 Tax=Streptococcus ruminantium TaxID=1917441 RepID=UPI001D141F51|nr:glycosyltransferase family 52 [Streptococcus ruminantium]